MKSQRLISTLCLAILAGNLWAQAPHDTGTYYQKAHGKSGRELKTAFYEIINTPAVIDYDSLWTAYKTSDAKPIEGEDIPIIWDMYSAISHYPVNTTLHGNGTVEGEKGFQREHSLPKSWFNPQEKSGSSKPTLNYKDVWPMYSDLMHVIPAEGKVNNWRSNNPYGENEGEFHASAENFSKMGACTYPGYTGRCFEPNDEYKGDIARIYFYMVTAYEKKQPTWSSTVDGSGDHCGTWVSDMFDLESDDPYQPFAPWAFQMLMEWAKKDPVSQKEIDRNEAVWKIQGNRNPFVDYPNLEDYIWGDKQDVAFDYGGELETDELTSDNCELALNKATFDVEWHPTEQRKEELTAEGKDWTQYDNFREYFERIPIVIEKDGLTITYSYGIYGKQLFADAEQIRLYNYNTLTFKAHNNKITKVEFTVPYQDAGKNLKAFVGNMDDNVWTGEEDEVLFTTDYVQSKYNMGTKTTTHFYTALSDVKVTVASPSGIRQMAYERQADGRIYNLMGVQVEEDQLMPGIYIKNGRKFVVR